MQSPVRRISDTTPPSLRTQSSENESFKSLMSEMASLFPKLPPQFQDQARQAHAHVQYLLRSDAPDQAFGLLGHMRDVMKTLIPDETLEAFPSTVASPPFKEEKIISENTCLAIPPLPPSTSPEMVALQRSLEELRMKVQEGSAVTLIAKRVRDMEMEQKYFQLEARLKDLKVAVSGKLDTIAALTDTASSLARKEVRKRTVSKNPFCEHEVGGFCEFCVGRDIDDPFLTLKPSLAPPISTPPLLDGALREDLVNKETVLQMQQSLKTYQATLKNLLDDRKRELESLNNF